MRGTPLSPELLAKLEQGSEGFRAQTQAQASTAGKTHQPGGEVVSRASASTASRTAECGVALGFTRMIPPEDPCKERSIFVKPLMSFCSKLA